MKVLVLNGPNLNLLGTREPEIYGSTTLAELEGLVRRWGHSMNLDVEVFQSNHEGELIDAIQRSDIDGIVINPAAYSHTSRAIADAISAVGTPTVEVHISNIKEREPWRAESVVSPSCALTIYGRGITGYRDALRHLVNRAAVPFEMVSYGPDAEQFGDLRRSGRGLVVLVHGGFWRREWERDTMESLAVDLHRRGFSTWNVEYRRLGVGGGWPGSFDDILAALDNVPELGLGDVPVVVLGHSAGGFMAMWLGPRSHTPIRLIVSMAAVTDLHIHARSGLYGAEEVQRLLDAGAPATADREATRTLLVHGEQDTHVPFDHASALRNGPGIELIAARAGHFQLLDPQRDPWPDVVDRIDRAISG